MKGKKKNVLKVLLVICIVLGAVVLLVLGISKNPVFAQAAQPVWRVDDQGNITVDGQIFRVKGGSWFGLEGRHEPSNDPDNPSGAPMEQYMGNVFWAESGRTYEQDVNEFKQMGFNLVRIPIAPQTLDPNDPQGRDPYLKNAQSVRIANSRLALETIIQLLDDAGIYVLLDIHSCSNYVGWRAGRFDARPPYADVDRDNYDFKRENCSCASSNNPSGVTQIQAYSSSAWLNDLRELAGMADDLGVSNIMGIDIFNEPWDYTWSQWSSFIDQAYQAINAVNSNILIFAQGISATAGNQDGTPDSITQTPHGVEETNPNWGENLYEAGDNPPSMPKNRLVFSPHTYGPSVFVQKMFMDPAQPECEGLEGDATGDNQCNIIINPTLLEQGWHEHFGYLKALGYAVVIGEWGGNPDWPDNAELRMQDRYSYITDRTVDWQWQNAFVDYLVSVGIYDTIYWSINPESGDTGGIYGHAYDPVSNTAGWGTWTSPQQRKLDLLAQLWNGGGSTTTTSSGTTTSSTGTTTSSTGTTTSTISTTTSTISTTTSSGGDCGTCNWYGWNVPICCNVQSGWGYENGRACVAQSTCDANSNTTTTSTGSTTTSTVSTTTSTASTTTSTASTTTSTASTTTSTASTTTSTASTTTSSGGGTCSPVNATISAGFTKDGAGTFCWDSSNLGSFINSWNLNTLEVNGTDCTNKYVFVSSISPIGGKYYVYYDGSWAWSHFEAR
jgi:aryl-phospho-beta-D-glucosidase BglC (GH1 family)